MDCDRIGNQERVSKMTSLQGNTDQSFSPYSTNWIRNEGENDDGKEKVIQNARFNKNENPFEDVDQESPQSLKKDRSRSKSSSIRNLSLEILAGTKTEKQLELEGIKTVIEMLSTISNFERLRILLYCKEPRNFAEITKDLRLNASSFTFHFKKLEQYRLIEKSESKYQTTEEGKAALEIVLIWLENLRKIDV